MSLETLLADLQERLGDTSAVIWTGSELTGYVQEGYDALTKATGCLWATQVAPDYAFAFSHTAEFEADYFEVGWHMAGCAQFTAEFERDYISNGHGPANHNHHWEYNGGYVTTTEVSALADLPTDLHEIERSTWNTIRIDAVRSRGLESDDSRYELNKGQVQAYAQDKDGLRKLRKWRVPSAAYQGYDYAAGTEDTGILRSVADVTPSGVINSWGELRSVDGETVIGGPWGVVRNIYKEQNNVRMEYRRRGLPLSANQDFEIPARYQTYVRHYAQARALEREGDGQDLELSAHYQARYEAGIKRMLKRKQAIQYQRKSVMGGASNNRNRKPPLARLPYNYGQVVR